MRDIKHLTRKKPGFTAPLFGRSKRRLGNSFKTVNPPKRRARLCYLLPFIALLLAAYPVHSILTSVNLYKPALSLIHI